jgi:hypothetical protein
LFKTKEGVETHWSKTDISSIGNDMLDNLYPFQKLGVQLVFYKKKKIINFINALFNLGLEYPKMVDVLLQMIWA